MRAVAAAVAAAYLVVLLALTFLPFGVQGEPGSLDLRLMPFRTIRGAILAGPGSQEYAVLIGNLLAFVPVGLLVPVVARSRSVLLVIGAGLMLSLAIEIGQLAISLAVGYAYRSADVDDIIVNTLGAVLGYAIFLVASAVGTWLSDAGR